MDKISINDLHTNNQLKKNKILQIIKNITSAYNNEITEKSLDSKTPLLQSNSKNFESAIKTIKNLFIADFEQNELSKVKNLLDKIKDGVATPVLFVCGKGTHEIRYTKYLTYFLNYKNNHGLGKKFFNVIFGDLLNEYEISIKENDEFETNDEFYLAQNLEGNNAINSFIDIAITSKDFNIFIEQKVLSGESINPKSDLNQLDRYKKAINITYPNQKNLKVYLTPNGIIPEGVSDWIGITHRELVEKGIALLNMNISEIAKSNLRSFLMDLSIGPYLEFDIIQKIKELSEDIINNKSIFRYTELKSLLYKNELLLTLINY